MSRLCGLWGQYYGPRQTWALHTCERAVKRSWWSRVKISIRVLSNNTRGVHKWAQVGAKKTYKVLQRRVGALHGVLPLVGRDALERQRAGRGGGRCLLDRLRHTRRAVSVQYGRQVFQQLRRHLPGKPARVSWRAPLPGPALVEGPGRTAVEVGGEREAAPRPPGPAATRAKVARRRTADPAPVSRTSSRSGGPRPRAARVAQRR